MRSTGNKTQPWFGAARRLGERSTDGHGLAVDKDGVTLGPDFPLIRKTSRGYETATIEELSCLMKIVSLGTGDSPRLARHLESIAKALSAGDLARARILGLYFPINRLTRDQSDRLRKASALLKGNFNPEEPRDERGRWTSGVGTAPPSDATSGAQTRTGTVARRPLATHPGVVQVQEFLPMPIDPEFLPKPLTGEEPFPPFDLSPREPQPVTLERCFEAANRYKTWKELCDDMPNRQLYAQCRAVLNEKPEMRRGFCRSLWET